MAGTHRNPSGTLADGYLRGKGFSVAMSNDLAWVAMTRSEFLHKIENIRTWRRRGEHAPHKALMLLLMLGRVKRGEEPVLEYLRMVPAFKKLIEEFGPRRSIRDNQTHRPFEVLEKDGIWWVEDLQQLGRAKNGHLLVSDLKVRDPRAGFSQEVAGLLHREPWLIDWAAMILLHDYFPETLHERILYAAGLSGSAVNEVREVDGIEYNFVTRLMRKRSPRFRGVVLAAYDHRCAVCGYDVFMDDRPVSIEAAHIHWHCRQGPDDVSNGLALCGVHHHALDMGGIALEDNFTILVSSRLRGSLKQEHFTRFEGGKLAHLPSSTADRPAPQFLKWHRSEVYRG